MMGTIAATLQNKVQKSLTNQKSLRVLMYVNFTVADKSNQIKSIVFLDSNEKQNVKHKLHGHKTNTHTHTHHMGGWKDQKVMTNSKIFRRLLSTWGTLSFIIR